MITIQYLVNKRLLLLGVLLFLLLLPMSQHIKAQRNAWSPERREIEVKYADSTIRAYISIQNISMRTNNNLMYYWYNNDHINYNMGGYDGLLLDGVYAVYNKQNKLITKGVFENGLKEGCWRYWNSEGKLRRSATYKNGILHGDTKLFDENGSVVEVKSYKKGALIQSVANKLKIRFKKEKPLEEELSKE